MDKLTIEEAGTVLEYYPLDTPEHGMIRDLAKQLADTMRENERLLKRIRQAVGGLHGHGDKYEAIGILEEALGHPNKDSENVG